MANQKIYDLIGIGIGPFNLGLAALCFTIPELNCLFLDQNNSFDWHPGMMLSGSRLQVPWYADLVALADPCNPFIYMKFLQAHRRMIRSAIGEKYSIKRTEYNEYCRWVISQLTTLQFGTACIKIEREGQFYKVTTSNGTFLAQKVVLGTGTVPFIPALDQKSNENIFHSADYTFRKENILKLDSITIVGSGQSAAEIFYDLLQTYPGKLNWFTRSRRFFPMDYSKLTLELSTPDYIDHFYSIPDRVKPVILKGQDSLYKGINHSLISDIYDLLLEKDSKDVKLHANCELSKISGNINLTFQHSELQKTFVFCTEALILATGYHQVLPECIKPLRPFIQLDNQGIYKSNRNYSIDGQNSIFIQNAESATHGFNAADLGLGPYRNAIILNTILGHERFPIEKNITFQTFGLPS